MFKQYFLLVVSYMVICITSAAPPSFVTKCKAEDSKCIKDSSKAAIPIFALGVPEFKVPVLDPSTFKLINASQGGLLFELTDVTVTGLRNCEPKKVERDLAKKKMYVNVLCTGKLDGQYVLDGNLFVVPIKGKGAVHVNLKSALVNIEMDLIDKKGEDGQNHWQIKSWTHNFELKEKSDVVFEHLYDDNELLGRAARELVKSNSNEVVMEIGPPVVKALVGKVVKGINNFFKAVPSSDLTLDN